MYLRLRQQKNRPDSVGLCRALQLWLRGCNLKTQRNIYKCCTFTSKAIKQVSRNFREPLVYRLHFKKKLIN